MKTAFLFPGQGSQYPGMGKDFFEASPQVRELFELASDTTGIDARRLLFDGTEEELKETVNTQISVTLVNLSSAAVLREKGIESQGCAGFSLGEYAALVDAGVLALERVFPLVKLRGEAMARAAAALDRSGGDPGMAAILGLSPERIEELLSSAGIADLFGANFNSPSQVVVSGTARALRAAEELFKQAGAKRVVFLNVSGPFHSPLLKSAGEELAEILASIPFDAPKKVLFSNVTGEPITTGTQARELAVRQVVAPVRWTAEETSLVSAGFTRIIEAGPGKVLGGLWKAQFPDIPCAPAGKLDQIAELL